MPPARPDLRAYESESLSVRLRLRGCCGWADDESEGGGRRAGEAESSRRTLEVEAVGALADIRHGSRSLGSLEEALGGEEEERRAESSRRRQTTGSRPVN